MVAETAAANERPALQLVCIKWGTAYGHEEVNRLFRSARRHSTMPFRFVCITTDDGPGYDAGIERVPFPEFALPFEEMKRGCRLKLSMFKPGLLDPDAITIYIDLDTALLGDPARLWEEYRRRPAMYMLPNAVFPVWRVQRLARPFIGEHYYFGNSSVLVFRPRDFDFIFGAFNEQIEAAAQPLPKRLQSDERFISYCCRDRLRVLNNHLAVKFIEEFMSPFPVIEEWRKRVPAIIKRRKNLVAMTFNGQKIKPAKILALKKGDVLRRKGLSMRWDHDAYVEYWR